ncbi:glycoside hydrolase family 3 N-terminal domain-containing protein [Methylotetracoccus oryzae]|uniref:glycoside hydrolase family 3 N-terminal domain-containing protein n=1 Tax=Methylotetracoccus oryzae TaxID=1919059 RepID=UPI00111A2E04|nr:glycoside hydrolase family 3 N-terminal domain-containing protein [Methylotetracoccus oryzae]
MSTTSEDIRLNMTFPVLKPETRRPVCWDAVESGEGRAVGVVLALALALVFGSPARSASSPAGPAPQRAASGFAVPRVEADVDALLRRMTLEEKIGQLVQYSAGQPTGPGTGRSDYEDMIGRGQIGSLLNVVDPAKINAYQRIAVEKSRLRIPLLFALDVTHGFKTEFPIPLGLASTWDPEIVEKAARVAAMEASAQGIRWTFSPMVDIARDARWGRMSEGAGEDPLLGGVMAAAYVKGYQGTSLAAPDSIAACVKHYVGYGAAEGGRDYNSAEISEHTLREIYLPPFHAAVQAGAASLMSAFHTLNGMPSTANPFTLRQILRKEWGFRGLVISDWSSIGELVAHGVAVDAAAAARMAVLAGVDVDMGSSVYHDHLQGLVQSGQIGKATLDEAVRHVLRVKFALGLFGRPLADESAAKKALYHPESMALAQTAAERSLVLLRNVDGPDGKALLPLTDAGRKIAVIGPLGDDASYPEGVPENAGPRESLPQALARRIGAERVSRFRGTGTLTGSDEEMAAAVAGARQADLVLLALGEDQTMHGEAGSRANLGLPGRQQELLEAVVKTGKPVVLVLFSGRPLTVPWAFEHVPAVISAWFPGVGGASALVRTLYGDVNPSGRLVVSWPRSVGQVPLYYNALSTGRPAGESDLTRPPYSVESKYVSRYVDEQNSPQFPFGYGGSYTLFAYGSTTISTTRLHASALNKALANGEGLAAPAMMVETTVTNTGSRDGEELVQVYVQLRGTHLAGPTRALKGFQRVVLAPGETKSVKFELQPAAFATWNERNTFAAEPAKVTVWIGPDAAHGASAAAEIVP